MKAKTQYLLNMILSICAIALLVFGVSEEKYIPTVLGGLCFLVILLLRRKQIKKMNEEIDNMERKIHDETNHSEDK